MKKEEITIQKVKNNPAGGVLIGKDKEGQTIIPNDGSLGGFFVGKLHKEGGIKAINMGNGQPIEVQSNEIIITSPAVADQTKREFEGKLMTNREILSKINSDGGGVSFAEGGEVPKSIKHTGTSYKYGGKTMTDHEIMMQMNGGGHLAEGFSLRDIADIHQVPLAELKKQVRLGMEAESEHTSSKREQMKIVKDHLFENPKYYTLLKKVGLKKGGEVKNSLVKDAKSGNSPSRDLNNYNDLLDVEVDGAVGGDSGIYEGGGEVETNLLDNQSFTEFKHSLEYVSKLDLTDKKNKNLASDVQITFFKDFVEKDLNANLKSYYEAIEILPKNKREYCFDLFERNDLFEKLDKNVFYYLPENLKKEPNVKKIDFAPTPSSENLAKITDLFTNKDMLRPIYSGVNFNLEEEEIEVTNSHILLLIKEKPHVSESGVYVIGKTKEWYLKKAENTKEDSNGLVKLEGKYPLVQRILPNEFDFVFSVDAEKFLRYANASEYFSNEYTNQIVIGFKTDNEHINSYGVSSTLLASCLKAMLMLGYNEIDVCLSESKNRAICLVPKGNSRKVSQRSLTTDLTLLMPMLLSGNESIMDNIYDLENDTPSTRSIMLNKEVKESVLEQENNVRELEPIRVEKDAEKEEIIDLGNNFEIRLSLNYYTNGTTTYGASLYYKNNLFKYFTILVDDSREKVIDNVYSYLKTLKVSDKIIETTQLVGEYGKKKNAPAYQIFYTDRGGEHLRVENNKKEIEEFIKDVKNITNKSEKTESNEVKEAIEVLELLSETAEGEDKKEIDEAIEILQMLLETSSYELGGKISNDDFTFRKIQTPLN